MIGKERRKRKRTKEGGEARLKERRERKKNKKGV